MKKKFMATVLALCMAASFVPAGTVSAAQGASENSGEGRDLSNIIGATVTGGYYEFDPSVSCLEDGANRVAEMGSKVIKLWLSEQTLTECYPYNTDWTQWEINNCVDILKTSYFQNVFNMDFTTYVLETHTFDNTKEFKSVDWMDGMTEEEKERVEDEMYQITKYLMIQYVGSGKEFVLQNWEGDNFLGCRFWRFDEETQQYYIVDDSGQVQSKGEDVHNRILMQIDSLIEWFNCRQAGVDRAMQEFGSVSDVRVRNALEINFTYLSAADQPFPYGDSPILLKTVVPFTDCDLYSYSCWSSNWLSRANSLQARLQQYQDAIGDYYYAIDDKEKETPIARRPMTGEGQKTKIMLGEFGAQERMQGSENSGGALTDELNYDTDRLQRMTTQIETEIALEFGVEYILYWEVYCNVLDPNVTINSQAGEQAESNLDVQGNYLVRPDGTYTEVFKYFRGLCDPDSLYIDEAYDGTGNYEIDGESGGFEVSGTLTTSELPSNMTGERDFDDKVTVQGSKDGVSYTDIPVVGFYSWTQQENGSYVSNVSFINVDPVDSDHRFFKVVSNATGDEFEIENVKFYKPNPAKLLKAKIFGSINGGEEAVVSKYVLESGDTIQLRPVVTMENWSGKIEYTTTNRYIASVDQNGKVLGRTNGNVKITVTLSGGGLSKPIVTVLDVTVRTQGELLMHDSFTNIETIAYKNNETKVPGEELDGFGRHMVGEGAVQYFVETDNIHFFRLDEKVSYLYENFDNQDPWMAYILDWRKPSGYIIYEADEDVGGYDIGMCSYGQNALNRINVFVSSDMENWQEINCLDTGSALASGYYDYRITNRQIIPEGMRYIKIQIQYTDANKWTPQLYDVKLFGEAGVNSDYVDTVKPTLKVEGTYPETVKQGDKVTLLQATYSDDFATKEELEYSVKVYMVVGEGMQTEVPVDENGQFTVSAFGEYRVEYSVTDLAGNKTSLTYTMQCKESEGESSGGCKGSLAAAGTMAGALLVLGAAVLLLKRKEMER